MAVITHCTKSLATLWLLAAASTASAQTSSAFRGMQPAVGPARPIQASTAAYSTASVQLARPSLAAAPMHAVPQTKPFQTIHQRPTISPYLQLHREELEDTLPNYFAFVRPQIQQQELIRQQQLELQNIHQRLQRTATQAPVSGPSADPSATQPQSFHARFLNTGNYFSGVPLPQRQLGASQ